MKHGVWHNPAPHPSKEHTSHMTEYILSSFLKRQTSYTDSETAGPWGLGRKPYLTESVNMDTMRRGVHLYMQDRHSLLQQLKLMCCESLTGCLSTHKVQAEPCIRQLDSPVPQYVNIFSITGYKNLRTIRSSNSTYEEILRRIESTLWCLVHPRSEQHYSQ